MTLCGNHVKATEKSAEIAWRRSCTTSGMPQRIRRTLITVFAAVAVLGLANRAFAIELAAHGILMVEPVFDSVSLLLLGGALTLASGRLKRRDASTVSQSSSTSTRCA
jgi:hypothetical protein